ncbi:MAG: hypothetical protein RL154_1559 [Pseudomonadota bacterium]|jgi:UTP-glucose-1-phosphate uridylyltransferase
MDFIMINVALNNPKIENYFKTAESISSFLEQATKLDLLSILADIHNDELHQKTISDLKSSNVQFYDKADELIKALNA